MEEEGNESTETSTTESAETNSKEDKTTEIQAEPAAKPAAPPAAEFVNTEFKFELPEKSEVNEKVLDGLKSFSIENKLSPGTAQAMVDHLLASRSEQVQAQKIANDETIKQNKDAIKADPDIGGSNYEAVQLAVDKVTLKYGGEDFKNKIINAGLKDDASFLKFIKNIDSVLSEDRVISPSRSPNPVNVELTEKQRADKFFK